MFGNLNEPISCVKIKIAQKNCFDFEFNLEKFVFKGSEPWACGSTMENNK